VPSVLILTDDDSVLSAVGEIGWDAVPVRGQENLPQADAALVDTRVPGAVASAKGMTLAGVPVILLVDEVSAATAREMDAACALGIVLRPLEARALSAALCSASARAVDHLSVIAKANWFRTALHCIGDAVIIGDAKGRVAFTNAAAQRLSGYQESDLLGRPIDAVLSLETTARAGAGKQSTSVLSCASGATLDIEISEAPVLDPGSELRGAAVVFRDVTEKRRMEARLSLSDRMASLGTLAAGVAHELNNPLAFVSSNLAFAKGELEVLRSKLAPSERGVIADIVAALDDGCVGVQRAANIVKDMYAFSRTKGDELGVVDVNRAAAFAHRLAVSSLRHDGVVTIDLAATQPVLANEGKLVQVVVNLITNAVQAKDGDRPLRAVVSTSDDDGHVVLSVSDTGRGIAPEQQVRVFEPFFTTKPVGQGLGLGLSISHSMITSFGGTLHVESEVGKGTTFVIRLPATQGAECAAASNNQSSQVGGRRVLVVDDEALIGSAVRRLLSQDGMQVSVEESSARALERLRGGERFDVILCDLIMPEFSGADLYHRLEALALEQASRMVFMTGNAIVPTTRAFLDSIPNKWLDKPFSPEALRCAVAAVLVQHD
jgi:PAS domain S-box-containing protein